MFMFGDLKSKRNNKIRKQIVQPKFFVFAWYQLATGIRSNTSLSDSWDAGPEQQFVPTSPRWNTCELTFQIVYASWALLALQNLIGSETVDITRFHKAYVLFASQTLSRCSPRGELVQSGEHKS